MNNIDRLEAFYQKVSKNLSNWLPEGTVDVDIELLHTMNLLNFEEIGPHDDEQGLTRYFHVVETEEKITLMNEQFAIWIVPDHTADVPATFTLIALNDDKEPAVEMAFSVSGVYNTSRMVLRVLEKFLKDIVENEEAMNQLRKAS